MPAPSGAVALDRAVAFRSLVVLLALGAWAALWAWSASPWSRYLEHGGWTDVGALAALCRAVPEGDAVVPALLHATAWLLMIAAMMLPTTLPVLEIFRRLVRERRDRRRLVTAVVAGYALAWLAFGLAAHAADWGVHALGARSPWLALHGWTVGAAIVAIAGAFQFSALKYRCLDRCHSPLGFVMQRWRGSRPMAEALRLGVDHGLFCVGCCWALMLLMFVVGTGSLGWMLTLALVMAAEKNLPQGRRLRVPLGVALLGWATAIALWNAGSWAA